MNRIPEVNRSLIDRSYFKAHIKFH